MNKARLIHGEPKLNKAKQFRSRMKWTQIYSYYFTPMKLLRNALISDEQYTI